MKTKIASLVGVNLLSLSLVATLVIQPAAIFKKDVAQAAGGTAYTSKWEVTKCRTLTLEPFAVWTTENNTYSARLPKQTLKIGPAEWKVTTTLTGGKKVIETWTASGWDQTEINPDFAGTYANWASSPSKGYLTGNYNGANYILKEGNTEGPLVAYGIQDAAGAACSNAAPLDYLVGSGKYGPPFGMGYFSVSYVSPYVFTVSNGATTDISPNTVASKVFNQKATIINEKVTSGFKPAGSPLYRADVSPFLRSNPKGWNVTGTVQ